MTGEGRGSGTWADAGLFIAVAVAGGLSLVVGPILGASEIALHCWVGGLMLLYAGVAGFFARFRLRRDQAGDNVYYLGLLFTLVSMMSALWGVAGDEERVDRLLAAFGVALTSTILGVLLRIVLHQTRVDPVDVEEVARQELADASNKLKSALEVSTQSFAGFPSELQTVIQDSIREIVTHWSRTAKEHLQVASAALSMELEALGGVVGTLKQRNAEVEQELNGLSEQVAAVGSALRGAIAEIGAIKAPPTKFAAALQKSEQVVVATTAELEDAQLALTDSAKSVSEVLVVARDAAAELTRIVDGVRAREHELSTLHRSAAGAVDESAQHFAKQLAAAGSAVDQMRHAATQVTKDQVAASRETIRQLDEAVRALTSTLNAVGK